MDLKEQARRDPRFNVIKKKATKVKVDSRFSKALKENKEFTRGAKKDAKGRTIHDKEKLDEYYDMEGDNDTYSQYSQESSSGSRISYGDALVIEQDDNVWDETQLENVAQIEEETSRLALVNFDWTHIKAKDIMMLVNSFKQDTGVILTVQIYKSEFGKQRMADELVNGPANIWNNDAEVKEENKSGRGREFNNDLWTFRREDEGQGIDMFKLRKYEMERMRYFFAVISLDSKETAKHIYEAMDGMEYEQTGLKIDLRYIQEEQDFEQDNLVEECDTLQKDYDKNEFIFRALGQTNVRLTWDQPNYNRFNHLHGDYDGDLGDVIASDSHSEQEDQDEEEEHNSDIVIEFDQKPTKPNKDDWRDDYNHKKKRAQQGQEEIEISFNTGFNTDIVSKVEQRKAQEDKNVYEKYLDKRQEKKKAKKWEKKQAEKEQQKEDKKQKQIKHKKEQQELSLLVDDKKEEEKFELDYQDERFFKPIAEDSRYSIDPTAKFFSKDKQKLLDYQVKARKKVKR